MITIPLLVCIVGGVVHVLASAPPPPDRWLRPVVARLALVCFAAGLLVTLWQVAHKTVF